MVSEALTNVARHSGATPRRRARRARTATGCSCPSSDDGHGGATEQPGGGLAGLRDRVRRRRRHVPPAEPADRRDDVTVEVPCAS